MQAWHIVVSGKVQGVYYRVSTAKRAEQLGVKGWVRNLPNGDVEMVAQGTEDQLNALYNWCHEGPVLAKVESVSRLKVPIDSKLVAFDVLK